jgi:hypothetical protein
VAVSPQSGCLTRDRLTAATSVARRGRLCDKSGRLDDKDSRLCYKHDRLCNKDSRLPIDPFSKTSSYAHVIELVIPQPNPSQINLKPAEGGRGRGVGSHHTLVFSRSCRPATGYRLQPTVCSLQPAGCRLPAIPDRRPQPLPPARRLAASSADTRE